LTDSTEGCNGAARRLTRRRFLAGAAAAAGAATVGPVLGTGSALAAGLDPRGSRSSDMVPFFGRHQAGIATAAPNYLCFAAFDLAPQRKSDIRDLMRLWTGAAARMTTGQPAGEPNTAESRAPIDTGEAQGLPPSRLTITFGFGPTMFELDGEDRFGLRSKMPAALQPLPAFEGDQLEPDRSDGDICVQACADDPQVAFHAVRNLGRLALGSVAMRWQQLGFGRTASTTRRQETARNLMGFKDGTDNLRSDDLKGMQRFVWAGAEGPKWMEAGSYLVARRIEISIDQWDGSALREQEHTFGRRKSTGAPLTGTSEYDPVDLKAVDASGKLIIPADAHIRIAAPSNNESRRILRRGYSFSERVDPSTGLLDAGLFFICFQRDPRTQFVPLQRNLSRHDHLNRYTTHTASALFAVPPGARPGGFVGAGLFVRQRGSAFEP